MQGVKLGHMIPQEYFDAVKKYYLGDEKKTWNWFQSIHPELGMFTPLNAIKLGKGYKVMNLINKKMR